MISHIVGAKDREVVGEKRRAISGIDGAEAKGICRRRLHNGRSRLVVVHAAGGRVWLRWIVVHDGGGRRVLIAGR